MQKRLCIFTMTVISACITSAFAATPVALEHQPVSILQAFSPTSGYSAALPSSSLKKRSEHTDFNQTTHIRTQQMFAGYPVWGADAVIHIPNGSNSSLATLHKANKKISH